MTDRELVRHTLAALAYRGAKPLRDAPASFPDFSSGPGGNTPLTILAHIGDLLDWALSHAKGEGRWTSAAPGSWDDEAARFHRSLVALDEYLASDAPLGAEITRLFQGPIADALTHVGQLMMLRRMAGSAVYGENYFVADIVTGRLGQDQAPPKRPF